MDHRRLPSFTRPYQQCERGGRWEAPRVYWRPCWQPTLHRMQS